MEPAPCHLLAEFKTFAAGLRKNPGSAGDWQDAATGIKPCLSFTKGCPKRAITREVATRQLNPGPGNMNIIGISCGYHDSACCLLQDGRLTAAAQEERFSRVKNDKSFPATAFRYCLNDADLTIADVDCIAFYEDPCQKLSRQL